MPKPGPRRLLTALAFCVWALFSFGARAAEIRVEDDLGRELVFDGPVKRIISLAPHNTENLFSAGAGDLIVGTVDSSDYPAAALDIPRVGNYTQFNIEAILKLKPDLIVAWASGNNNSSVQRLIDLGLPVFFSEPSDFEKIISNIERFAQLSGQQAIAAPRLAEMRSTISALTQQYSNKSPVSVFYQVWAQPLITLNGKHSVSRSIEICGGINVFSDEPTIAPKINIEAVIAKNPQLILLAGHDVNQASSWIEYWNKWPAIDAVRQQQLRPINADIMNRPTQRFLEGARTVCTLIDDARRRPDTNLK